MNEHLLPSSLPPDEFLVFIGGPRFRGMYAINRSSILESNEKIVVAAGKNGLTTYEDIRDGIMKGLHDAMIVSTEMPTTEILRQIGTLAVWIIWNEPEAARTLPTLRWMVFGADDEGFLLNSGADDASFEELRSSITEQVTGEPVVKH